MITTNLPKVYEYRSAGIEKAYLINFSDIILINENEIILKSGKHIYELNPDFYTSEVEDIPVLVSETIKRRKHIFRTVYSNNSEFNLFDYITQTDFSKVVIITLNANGEKHIYGSDQGLKCVDSSFTSGESDTDFEGAYIRYEGISRRTAFKYLGDIEVYSDSFWIDHEGNFMIDHTGERFLF